MSEPLTVADYERLAEIRSSPAPSVSSPAAPATSACSPATSRRGAATLRPRVLVDVSEVSTATTVLGTPVSMPVLVAPSAFQRMAHPGRRARDGAGGGRGRDDHVPLDDRHHDARRGGGRGARRAALVPALRVPRPRRRRARSSSGRSSPAIGAIVLTVDAPRLGRRERDLRTGFSDPGADLGPSVAALRAGGWDGATALELDSFDPSLTWRDLDELARARRCPSSSRGSRPRRTRALACEHGAAAIVVSNHGGRQLDGVAPTAELLPEVTAAVAGRIEVLVDGGIRRGTDVVKALALGARAVLVGRPAALGARPRRRGGRAPGARAAPRRDRARARALRLHLARRRLPARTSVESAARDR